MIQSFITFNSMNRTLKCAHSFESCRAALNCILPSLQFINFGLGTVRNERVKDSSAMTVISFQSADKQVEIPSHMVNRSVHLCHWKYNVFQIIRQRVVERSC